MFEDEEGTESGLWMGRVSDRDTGTARNAAGCVKRFEFSCVYKADICMMRGCLFDSQATIENGRVFCTCDSVLWSGFISPRRRC